jgi:hypothetical protein
VGKQTVDTFFVRTGDVLSALLVFGFAQLGDVPGPWLAIINVTLAVGRPRGLAAHRQARTRCFRPPRTSEPPRVIAKEGVA